MSRHANTSTRTLDLDLHFMRSSLWPAILYTVILMVVGTVGNILVLIVYRRQFQRSVTRTFIYALAILDLCNCVITMPAELDILIQFTSFPSPVWCKLSRYLTYIFNGTSSVVLIAIAMDRYFKVCRLRNTLITVHRAKIICAVSLFITSILSIPALVIYGEIKLHIRISNGSLLILPLTNDHRNASSSTQGYRYTTESSSGVSDGTTDNLVYGRFCLLNSHYIEGTAPILFYVSMFSLYLVMVVLVVFFYSKVARTMFILKSKHSKMFSFYNHKSSTPSSNSEANAGNFPKPASSVVINEASVDQERSLNASGKGSKVCREASTTKEEEQLTEKHGGLSNSGTSVLSAVKGNAGETGYETDESSSDRETEQENCQCKEQFGSEQVCRKHNIERGEKSKSCVNMGNSPKDSEQRDGNTGAAVDNELQRNNIHSRKSSSAGDLENMSPNKPGSRKKQRSKTPKIKVHKASVTDDSTGQLGQPDFEPSPFSTNSLLRRRIKSADNINHLSRLHKLQVPDRRAHGAIFPDLTDIGKGRAKSQRTSQREKPTGKVTGSCVNLDVTDNPVNNQEKTLTLTRMSGKKRICVLPLTGIATKAVSHVQEIPNYSSPQNGQADKGVFTNKNSQTSKSDSKLDLPPQSSSQTKDTTSRSTPVDLNSADLDSVVTLRNRTPEAVKSFSLTQAGRKPGSVQIQFAPAPRKEIISAADILQEQHRRGSLHPYRTSRMLFAISLIFVISFLPFFVIALARSSMGSSFMSMNEVELGVISVFIRSSLISNAVNPIVYGLLSTHFRRECTGVMFCIFRR